MNQTEIGTYYIEDSLVENKIQPRKGAAMSGNSSTAKEYDNEILSLT